MAGKYNDEIVGAIKVTLPLLIDIENTWNLYQSCQKQYTD